MEQGRPVNLQVHQRNNKGEVTGVNPYRLVIENGQQLYEVPPGSGQFFSANGHLVKDMSAKDKEKFQDKVGKGEVAPQSQPFGKPDPKMLGKVEQKEEDDEDKNKVKDDHTRPDKAQQEYDEQQGKATSPAYPGQPPAKK